MHYQDIAQIKEAYLKLDDKYEYALREIENLQSLLAQAKELKALLSRAADALEKESWPSRNHDYSALIAHLRKAAQ